MLNTEWGAYCDELLLPTWNILYGVWRSLALAVRVVVDWLRREERPVSVVWRGDRGWGGLVHNSRTRSLDWGHNTRDPGYHREWVRRYWGVGHNLHQTLTAGERDEPHLWRPLDWLLGGNYKLSTNTSLLVPTYRSTFPGVPLRRCRSVVALKH